jgi:hypothetical protein
LHVLLETKSKEKDAAQAKTQRKSRHRWHAVTIIGSASMCAAAQACKGKRFLSPEAPRLPIAGCDAEKCSCRYRHFVDRRAGPRRAEERGAAPARAPTNRRAGRDRRAPEESND